MPTTLGARNPDCVIRNKPCGMMLGGSNTCFIASPSADHVGLELLAIKAALREQEIDAYVAVENYDPGKDVFCTKICSKIIESRLCVVLLTEPRDEQGRPLPNPNVHYEYGLMTAWNKPIIPMQREGHDLAFNVRQLDTVKYSNKDMDKQFGAALRKTLAVVHLPSQDTGSTGALLYNSPLWHLLQSYMTVVRKAERASYETGPEEGTPFLRYTGWKFAAMVTGSEEIDSILHGAKAISRRLEWLSDALRDLSHGEPICNYPSDPSDIMSHMLERITNRMGKEKMAELTKELMRWEIVVIDCSNSGLADDLRNGLPRAAAHFPPRVTALTLDEARESLKNA